ncbi:MAG: transposase [Anaerolineae bacterium]|nr:transposase [Anaerolineae bacterium]
MGKGSKVRVVVEGNGLPIGLHVASAQPHELTLAEPTLNTICVPQKQGRPKSRPKSWWLTKPMTALTFAASCGIKPTIPTFQRRKPKSPKRGRPLRVGTPYRHRWKVERCFARMDNCRRLVVRYDRHLHIYKAFCLLAISLWCLDRILK